MLDVQAVVDELMLNLAAGSRARVRLDQAIVQPRSRLGPPARQ